MFFYFNLCENLKENILTGSVSESFGRDKAAYTQSFSDWVLICPLDHSPLSSEGTYLVCSECARRYPVRDDIACFLDEPNPFYEGAYSNQVRYLPAMGGLLGDLPLWLVSHGYVWAVRKFVAPRSAVVEIGCAGGVAWFGRRYRMCGADLSLSALRLAAENYALCVQTDVERLPLPDASTDAVISSSFWEHIAPDRKPVMLEEFRRVLKPGGLLVFVYDVATENPLIDSYRRKRPDLFQALFLDGDGHIGYQSCEENDRIFEQAGYTIVRSLSYERSPLLSPSVWSKFAQWPGLRGRIGRVLCALGRKPLLFPYLALLRLIDISMGRLMPGRWGRIALTVARKV